MGNPIVHFEIRPADPGAARKTCKRRDDRVFAYVAVVTDLNQIVDEAIPDNCFVKGRQLSPPSQDSGASYLDCNYSGMKLG